MSPAKPVQMTSLVPRHFRARPQWKIRRHFNLVLLQPLLDYPPDVGGLGLPTATLELLELQSKIVWDV
ncbi:hypothetical protein ATO1_25895 [Phaeobacter sp. 22II1-1F12B]|nr:hypothetical protein ATO1_25895 [Phaeobacter sp. 22II1-1F12B]